MVPRFEQAVAAKVGARHAVAVNSATSALHIACLALDLEPGDRLWTVPNTFVASANCGRYCGAEVDFVDIDPDTWNLSVPRLHENLLQAKQDKRLPGVMVPVHGQFPEAEAHGDEAITLPLYPTLSEGEQDRVVTAVKRAIIGPCISNGTGTTYLSVRPELVEG